MYVPSLRNILDHHIIRRCGHVYFGAGLLKKEDALIMRSSCIFLDFPILVKRIRSTY